MAQESITLRQARRLALAAGGLLKPQALRLPSRAAGTGARARKASISLVEHFGYLQLDSVAVTGARTHSIVLGSRLAGMHSAVGEQLLEPTGRLFEYWGHEASWIPMSLYPAFEFRRQEFTVHPWYGDVIGTNRSLAGELLARLRDQGPLRSLDLEGESRSSGWGSWKLAQRVLEALWSAGEVAIRGRRNFQRIFDLTERVIPASVRVAPMPLERALETLLSTALQGHGWATAGTLAATFRLRNKGPQIKAALARLESRGAIVACALDTGANQISGWTTPRMLELLPQLERARPRADAGVLLSPFDPVLWDRGRVRTLFGFEQVLEIYKPARERRYGYYCLPLLAGDRLVGRADLKADRKADTVRPLSLHFEDEQPASRAAMQIALGRFADFVRLELID